MTLKRVAILGAGGMGTAMALLWTRSALESIGLWGRNETHVKELLESRENRRHLPGVILPESILATSNIGNALSNADLIVAAIPSAFLRSSLRSMKLAGLVPDGVPVMSVIKGVERETLALPSSIILEEWGTRPVFVLSGPSHAEELARGLPASVVLAGSRLDLRFMIQIQESLNHGMLRVYTNFDSIGVELAGALKNVMAIAAGVCEGLGLGDNAKAALLTRGLVEMARLAIAMGGHPATFSGLAGVGDLLTTCYSKHGRNRAVGVGIGQGATLAEILGRTENVAEGVTTCPAVLQLAQGFGVEMPIVSEVQRVLYENKSPLSALRDLMLRAPKEEWPL